MIFPKSRAGELEHRRRKRVREIAAIMEALRRRLGGIAGSGLPDLDILEIGSGNGFQIPYLRKLGRVVASDIYIKDDLKRNQNPELIQCDVNYIPFCDNYFDLVFLNHVLVYMSDMDRVFAELQRVGHSDCIYAISVPTSLWLLLSVPAQYRDKLSFQKRRSLWDKLNRKILASGTTPGRRLGGKSKWSEVKRKALRKLLPSGYGVYPGFSECWRAFSVRHWKELFERGGFTIEEAQPLLLYGPSEWPLIPTTAIFNAWGLSSSVLFLLKKTPVHYPNEKSGLAARREKRILVES
ncbi:MAG TPA: class I SAM-dependent methyltransferase [bacterium]|jgi:SAM-dependent methyltransferase